MPKAAVASRPYEKANLSCGLINIPLSVYSLTSGNEAGISRKMFTKDNHPVGYASVDKETNKLVDRADVVKKIETEYGFVYVEDHEIEALFAITPKTLIVKSFQPRALFGTVYVPVKPYSVEPTPVQIGKRKVSNAAAEKVLTLLLTVLEEREAVAFVEFTTRGVPKPAVLLPDGTLWTVYHEEELRERRPLEQADVSEAELAQGRALVQMLWNDAPEDLCDHRTALIQGFADDKAKAGDFDQSEEKQDVEVAPQAPAMDLMALLSASVEAAKSKAPAAA